MTKYKQYLKALILLLSVAFLLFVSDFTLYINQKTEDFFHSAFGEKRPDTNIVIIHIDQKDIDNLGPWPLKRSYYALLINRLSKLQAKTIALEVFLSDKFTSQSIYNDLLNGEIMKSGRVVLSSMIDDFNSATNSGRLIYPQPKKTMEMISTGHLNYIYNYGIFIPLVFNGPGYSEKAFSNAIMDKSRQMFSATNTIKLNITNSWKNFKNYSMLEFFDLYESNRNELKGFENKIVLIGVSAPQQSAQLIQTSFESELPGIGLHAFALDNLMNNRFINTKYNLISAIIFVLLLAAFIWFNIKLRQLFKYLILSGVVLFISWFCFDFLFTEFNYAFFLFPFTVLAFYDAAVFFIDRNRLFSGMKTETGILKKTLSEKEAHLLKLQKELDLTGQDASQKLLEKISLLKAEIESLRFQQTDLVSSLSDEKEGEAANFHGIVYRSKAMSQITSLINKVAPVDATILILGESGTGKELVARAMHLLNEKRKQGNFIAVNCAALSDTLLESELFGHVKGAFTNAIADKAGRFEAADKGTIFLDEIGETSENFQVKLLRVLQSGEFEKVGSSKTMRTDVRVIAATNKNLEELVKQKKFREDLYYRLNVIKIELPPLRERKEDIEAIAFYFLTSGKEKFDISRAALDSLKQYNWKGNVRELESVIKRAIIFASSAGRNIIKLNDLPDELIGKDKANLEALILESLRDKNFSHSSINETARELGDLSRTIVSENFRGMVFRAYCSSCFDLEKTVSEIACSDEPRVVEKVRSKVSTFINNVEEDVKELGNLKFDEIRLKLNSKYKNLPQKYHIYLDEIIRNLLN